MPTFLIPAPTGPTSAEALIELAYTLLDWGFTGLLLVAVIFALVAAFEFITGGGEPQQIEKARHRLLWGAVALGAALLSRAAIFAAQNIFGA